MTIEFGGSFDESSIPAAVDATSWGGSTAGSYGTTSYGTNEGEAMDSSTYDAASTAALNGLVSSIYASSSGNTSSSDADGIASKVYNSLFGTPQDALQTKGLIGQMLAGGAAGLMQARAADKLAQRQRELLETNLQHDSLEKDKQRQFQREQSAVPRLATNNNFNWSK
jgi:hypothetical protein